MYDLLFTQLDEIQELPRPIYGHVKSWPNMALDYCHEHPWIQFSYAIQGVLDVETATGRFVAPPQLGVWVPQGVVHQVHVNSRTVIRSLYVSPKVVGSQSDQCKVLAVNSLLKELINRFSQFPALYAEDGAQGRIAQVLLDELLTAPEASTMLTLPTDRRLQPIVESLQEKPYSGETLAHWAEHIGVSEKTLSRLFVEQTGCTFRAWRRQLRLLKALTLLEQQMSVTEVALLSGYDSVSAFIAAFSQQFGITPRLFFKQ